MKPLTGTFPFIFFGTEKRSLVLRLAVPILLTISNREISRHYKKLSAAPSGAVRGRAPSACPAWRLRAPSGDVRPFGLPSPYPGGPALLLPGLAAQDDAVKLCHP